MKCPDGCFARMFGIEWCWWWTMRFIVRKVRSCFSLTFFRGVYCFLTFFLVVDCVWGYFRGSWMVFTIVKRGIWVWGECRWWYPDRAKSNTFQRSRYAATWCWQNHNQHPQTPLLPQRPPPQNHNEWVYHWTARRQCSCAFDYTDCGGCGHWWWITGRIRRSFSCSRRSSWVIAILSVCSVWALVAACCSCAAMMLRCEGWTCGTLTAMRFWSDFILIFIIKAAYLDLTLHTTFYIEHTNCYNHPSSSFHPFSNQSISSLFVTTHFKLYLEHPSQTCTPQRFASTPDCCMSLLSSPTLTYPPFSLLYTRNCTLSFVMPPPSRCSKAQ